MTGLSRKQLLQEQDCFHMQGETHLNVNELRADRAVQSEDHQRGLLHHYFMSLQCKDDIVKDLR